MPFWWVNQNQTLKEEIQGGFVWSPKRNKDGAFNRFYENMKLVEPGDLIFSFADGRIRYVGIASDRATTTPKPEFGGKGENWSRDGWLVPVKWTELTRTIQPKSIIRDLRPTLPSKYSPLTQEGNGLQGVYLASIPEDMAKVLFASSNEAQAIASGISPDIENEPINRVEQLVELRIKNDTTIDATVKQALILARRGQGKYRKNLESIESCCRLTGVDDKRFLRASHIKPWRLCETDQERLDGFNGLLLTPTFDHLFDKGYITFEDDGTLRVSERVPVGVIHSLGLPQSQVTKAASDFTPEQMRYLGFHRAQVFLT